MADLMLFDKQVNYKKWARQNDNDTDDDDDDGENENVVAFGPEVMDYRYAFGVKAN